MGLENRLNILREGNMLSDENYRRVQQMIQFFYDTQGVPLTEENGAAFVTHFCGALQRAENGQVIRAMDPFVLEAARSEAGFAEAEALSAKILQLCPCLPPEELPYMAVHLAAILINTAGV